MLSVICCFHFSIMAFGKDVKVNYSHVVLDWATEITSVSPGICHGLAVAFEARYNASHDAFTVPCVPLQVCWFCVRQERYISSSILGIFEGN